MSRILVLDIETSPNLAYVWGLFNQNVALNQIESVGEVISFAWKWHGQRKIEFVSVQDEGNVNLVQQAHALLDEADVVVTWNGTSFDVPHLQREIVLAGLTPPSPFKQIDLYLAAKKQFRFTSNKLDHVAQQLGVGAKTSHSGFTLWKKCMAGDEAAWRLMRRYNMRDVEITDKVYTHLKPWLPNPPHLGLFRDNPEGLICGRCESKQIIRRGYAVTTVGKFQRFQCQDCGGWSRAGRRESGVDVRPTP